MTKKNLARQARIFAAELREGAWYPAEKGDIEKRMYKKAELLDALAAEVEKRDD